VRVACGILSAADRAEGKVDDGSPPFCGSEEATAAAAHNEIPELYQIIALSDKVEGSK
jgi:hypothetical protein